MPPVASGSGKPRGAGHPDGPCAPPCTPHPWHSARLSPRDALPGIPMDMNLSKVWKIVRDREAWHAAVRGITRSWTQLRD